MSHVPMLETPDRSALKHLPNAAGAEAQCPLYFLHIPRAADTTLNSFLDVEIFSRDAVYQSNWRTLLRNSQEDLSQFRLFHGHLYASFAFAYPGPLRYITFIRDPIERALSHYGHVMRDERHYLHDLARRLGSFKAYLNHPETRPTVVNFQVRALGWDVNPYAVAKTLSEGELDEFKLERWLETSTPGVSNALLLDSAVKRLEQFCFVGITERFDISIRLLCETFGWPLPQDMDARNFNSGRVRREDLPADVLRDLVEANQADLALYEHACRRFDARVVDMRQRSRLFDAFISYAQNGEDVLLNRALADVGSGFYIDVGAQEPTGDSVTRAFYDRGWHGINIEPSRADHAALAEARPRDVNMNVAVADLAGERTFFEVPGTGLATLDADLAERHRQAGFEVVARPVSVRTLSDLCDELAVADIHFLKIDVEGAEKAVLQGFDLERYRPWVVLMEATEPNSTVPTHGEWEHLLTRRGYVFAFFDGLNRYYLAQERAGLLAKFTAPPNVFDRYVRYSEWQAVQSVRKCRVEAEIAATRLIRAHASEMDGARKEMGELRKWAESAEQYAKSLEKALGRS
ncbi:MAG: FkbM family methyltransferase [Pseudomonadota bacterium]